MLPVTLLFTTWFGPPPHKRDEKDGEPGSSGGWWKYWGNDARELGEQYGRESKRSEGGAPHVSQVRKISWKKSFHFFPAASSSSFSSKTDAATFCRPSFSFGGCPSSEEKLGSARQLMKWNPASVSLLPIRLQSAFLYRPGSRIVHTRGTKMNEDAFPYCWGDPK